ncbi:hypothetical protein DIPPA_08962 [Diplonema papillatum]|nr:hypothetical protein DIPPA_08962 [Diplonema papillatum]
MCLANQRSIQQGLGAKRLSSPSPGGTEGLRCVGPSSGYMREQLLAALRSQRETFERHADLLSSEQRFFPLSHDRELDGGDVEDPVSTNRSPVGGDTSVRHLARATVAYATYRQELQEGPRQPTAKSCSLRFAIQEGSPACCKVKGIMKLIGNGDCWVPHVELTALIVTSVSELVEDCLRVAVLASARIGSAVPTLVRCTELHPRPQTVDDTDTAYSLRLKVRDDESQLHRALSDAFYEVIGMPLTTGDLSLGLVKRSILAQVDDITYSRLDRVLRGMGGDGLLTFDRPPLSLWVHHRGDWTRVAEFALG